MAAFELALAAGVDGIETDVRLTADGIACLIHDPDLDRTTDQAGPVVERTMTELARCDAAAGAGTGHAFSSVPSLAQLAARCRRRATLCLDLKVDGAAQAIQAALAATDFPQHDATICIWNPQQLDDARRWLPDAPLFYIEPRDGSPSRRDDSWFAELARDYAGLSLAFEGLDATFAQSAHSHGLQLITWTVNEAADLEAALRFPVDGIITDDPQRLRQRLPVPPAGAQPKFGPV